PLRERHRETHLVLPRQDLRRHDLLHRFAEEMLQAPALELDHGGHSRYQLHDPMVQERNTRLEPHRHTCTILNRKKGWQGPLAVKVRHAVDKRREVFPGVECVKALVWGVGWIDRVLANQRPYPLSAVN